MVAGDSLTQGDVCHRALQVEIDIRDFLDDGGSLRARLGDDPVDIHRIQRLAPKILLDQDG